MRKILALLLALGMLASLGMVGFAEEMTDVGTPRNQTLIVESQTPTDVPGQFNSYMMGTQMGFGIHQLMSAHLWEMDTVSGEQFGEVAEGMPESNEDFTEHIVKLRQGIKWSDGEDLNADDVVFTFNMIMSNPGIGASGYANTVFASVEKVDDYTVKFVTNESFPRLALRFGVTVWGHGLPHRSRAHLLHRRGRYPVPGQRAGRCRSVHRDGLRPQRPVDPLSAP